MQQHEPECIYHTIDAACICDELRAAYQRGIREGAEVGIRNGRSMGYSEGYRQGYNDHAESRAHAEQMYGPYTEKVHVIEPVPDKLSQYRSVGYWHEGTFHPFNQHGSGENP